MTRGKFQDPRGSAPSGSPPSGSAPFRVNPRHVSEAIRIHRPGKPRQRTPRSVIKARRLLSHDDFRNLVTISSASIACFDFSPPIPCSLNPESFVDSIFLTPSRCLEASLTFALSTGHPNVDSVIGRPLSELLPRHAGYESIFDRWRELSLSGQGFESTIRSLQGESLTFQTVVYGRMEHDHLERLWIVLRDVTPQARAVQALTQAELHYRSLVERPGLLLIRMSLGGEIEYMSRCSQDLLGLALEDMTDPAAVLEQLSHPDDRERIQNMALSRSVRSSVQSECELRLRLKNGEFHWFVVRQYPKLSASGCVEHYDLLAFDVQGQREMELKLAQYSKSALVGQMSAGLAHDLNNHLTAIRCQLELADSLTPSPSAVQDAIRAAQRAVGDCHRMGQHLLAVGRGGSSQPGAVNVADLIHNSLALIKYVIPPRISIRLSCGEPTTYVWCDAVQLQQVIINLVLNARDAIAADGEISVTLSRVSLRAAPSSPLVARPSSFVCISVRDNGSGISEEALGHLFSPFFSTKSERGGNGLGLCMVKSLVEAQNGMISFANEPSGGATFSVYLPLLTGSLHVIPPVTDTPLLPLQLTIVITEDTTEIRHALAHALSNMGHHVTTCGSAAELDSHLASHPAPDIILLDEHLPDQTSSKVLPKFASRHPKSRIILMSGEPGGLRSIEASHLGIATIQKPFALGQLIETIAHVMTDMSGKET